MYLDSTTIMLLAGAAVTLLASGFLHWTYNKYKFKTNLNGYTGEQVAEMILLAENAGGVGISQTSGDLTDHYDPKTRTVCLSQSVFGMRSIAAVAVAAHECGHAIQHKEQYAPLMFRSALVPYANLGSKLGIPIVLLGWYFGLDFNLSNGSVFSVAQLGIIIFSLAILFQLVTLPVEIDASNRALVILARENILEGSELKGARKMLTAAALTYVAAAASAVLQLLRIVLLNGRRSKR
ncbi:MAG: zinc metallopeptidase [Lachnospiraceae bacterium]|nr:zinc metallopeptidase [Lachnospiraceae bacterium]